MEWGQFQACRKSAKNGAPGAIRTRGPQIRNLMLYPAELRVPAFAFSAGGRGWQRFYRIS